MRIIPTIICVFFCSFLIKAQNSVNNIIPYKENNKWGFCYKSLDSIVAKPSFSRFESFQDLNNNIVKVYYKVYSGDKVGLLNERGVLVFDTIYQDLSLFGSYTEGYSLPDLRVGIYARKDNLVGVLDLSAKIIIPIKYDYIELISPAWDDSVKILFQLYMKDSVFLVNENYNMMLKTAKNKNEYPQFIFQCYGYWAYEIYKKGVKYTSLLNSSGVPIIKAQPCYIEPLGLYDENGISTKRWSGTFLITENIKKSNSANQRLMIDENGNLGKRFYYIDRNPVNDTLFLVQGKKKNMVIYNRKSDAVVKFNNSNAYSANYMANDGKNKNYSLYQGNKMAVISGNGKVLLPFTTEQSYSLEDMYAGNNLVIVDLHINKENTSNAIDQRDTNYYYNIKGEYLFKFPASEQYRYHLKSKTYFQSNAVINFSGDTILYSKEGTFFPLNCEYGYSSDTLTGMIYNYNAYPHHNAYLYKISDKAILVDSGYIETTPDVENSKLFKFASKRLVKGALDFDKIYDKNLNLIFNGGEYLRTGYGYFLKNNGVSATYDNDLKLIARDTCAFLWKSDYWKAKVIPNKNKCYCEIDISTGKKVGTTIYSEYVDAYPFDSFKRLKIENKYYLANERLELLHLLDDTISSTDIEFWQKYIGYKLFNYPLSIKRAYEIICGSDALFTNMSYYQRPNFFITTKGDKYSLYDSIGNLKVINDLPLSCKKQHFTNEFIHTITKGAFIRGDSLFWYKPEQTVKFKLDTNLYDKNYFNVDINGLIYVKRKGGLESFQYQNLKYDLLNLNGELVYEEVRLRYSSYQYEDQSIIITEDGTNKLIDKTGKLLYEDKKEIILWSDRNNNLLYLGYQQKDYNQPSNIIFFINAEGKPIISSK